MKAFHQERVARKSGIEMAIAHLKDQHAAVSKIPDSQEHKMIRLGRKYALEDMHDKLIDEMRLIKDSEVWLTKNS